MLAPRHRRQFDELRPRRLLRPGGQSQLFAPVLQTHGVDLQLAGRLLVTHACRKDTKKSAESGRKPTNRVVLLADVVQNSSQFVSPPMAILAATGSGKSYAAGVLIEELLRPCN
jgi:hypothetical protein